MHTVVAMKFGREGAAQEQCDPPEVLPQGLARAQGEARGKTAWHLCLSITKRGSATTLENDLAR